MKYFTYIYIFFVYIVLITLMNKIPFLYTNMDFQPVEIKYTQIILVLALAVIFFLPYIVIKYSKLTLDIKIKTTWFLRILGGCILLGLVLLEMYFYFSEINPQKKEFWSIYIIGEIGVLNIIVCVALSSFWKHVKLGDSTEMFKHVFGQPEDIQKHEEGYVDHIYSSGLCVSFDLNGNSFAMRRLISSNSKAKSIDKVNPKIGIGKFLHNLINKNKVGIRLFVFAIIVFAFVFFMLFTPGTQTVKECRKAAEQGDIKAQYKLGITYLGFGNSVLSGYLAPDSVEGIKWITKAAEQGEVKAQYLLARCYLQGLNVKKNYTKAIRWYTKAAEQGDITSQYDLGLIYFQGIIVKKNLPKSKEWFIKAARQGNIDAQRMLSKLNDEFKDHLTLPIQK